MGISPEAIKKVVSNVVDFDMHNLFEPEPFMEKLEEAAKGTYESYPEYIYDKDLHGGHPLMIRPDYGPNFIDRYLRVNPEGGTVVQNIIRKYQKHAADPNNLWDFSMPSEMHKMQQQPIPRVILDEYIEFDRPTEHFPGEGGGGMDVLRDWYNRGWDPADAPEMSEDILERYMKPPSARNPGTKLNPLILHPRKSYDIGNVIASYMLNVCPQEVEIELDGLSRVAMLLDQIRKPRVYNKDKGYHDINIAGVSFRLKRADPKNARWVFETSSGGDRYTTVFQFKPEGSVRDLSKLNVLVSCECNSWFYWGAQYNAFRNRYLYGPIKLRKGPFGPPRKRDPQNRFTVCKHIAACVDTVLGYILPPLAPEVKKRLRREEKTRVVLPEGKVRVHMPPEIAKLERKPDIKNAVLRWRTWPPEKQEEFIKSLKNPDEVAFFAYRFPDTATAFVADRLRTIAESKEDHKTSKRAEDLLKDIV